MMSQDWRRTINNYFDDLLYGDFPVDAFCAGYEKWWNFDRPDSGDLTPEDEEALKSVFDVVVVFSPFENELRNIPMYRSEKDVRSTVKIALANLKEGIS